MMNVLQGFNTLSIVARLSLAMIFGGIIGLERGRKWRAAGFRTYMLVCLGATLTMILGQYLTQMAQNGWHSLGSVIDISRFGAQVINGVGFLGAGTVIVTGDRQVKGLTTAAGLWASACVGLAIGAGFWSCVLFAFVLIVVVVRIFPKVECYIVEHSKNMSFYLEFDALENVRFIISKMKANDAQICEMEIYSETESGRPGAVFTVRLNARQRHTSLLLILSKEECVRLIEER